MSDIEVLGSQYFSKCAIPEKALSYPSRNCPGKGGTAGGGGGNNAEHATHTTYINAFMRETRSDCGTFFFGITEEEGEFLDGGHGNVSTVVAGQKGLRNAHQATVSRQFSSQSYISKPMLQETGRGNRRSELTLPLRSRKNKADAMV